MEFLSGLVMGRRRFSALAIPRSSGVFGLPNVVDGIDLQTRSTIDTITMADFNGTSQWLECADHADFNITNGKMSVTFVANRRNAYVPNATGGDQDRTYLGQMNYNVANGGGWAIKEGDGVSDNWNIFVWIATNSTGSTGFNVGTGRSGTGRVTPWSQCTVVIDLAGADYTTKVKIYLDGVLQANLYYSDSTALGTTTAFQNPTSVFNIGRLQGLGWYYDGCMCRVGFWNGVALTSGNVTTLWNGGATLDYTGLNAAGLDLSAAFWLNMDEASGTRADSLAAHDFTLGNGAQAALEVVTEVRAVKSGRAFTAEPGIGPIYSATGFRATFPALIAHNAGGTGYLKGLFADFFRNAAPQDILDATAWGTIISSTEAGIFGVSKDATKYVFTSGGWVTSKDGDAGYTDRMVPVLRVRDGSSPNDIIFMDVTGLVANEGHTTHWRLTGTGGTLASSYKGWFDNASATIARGNAGTGVNNSFANIPSTGNDYQGLMAYPTGAAWQGTQGKLVFAGLILASGNSDTQATVLRDAWEERMWVNSPVTGLNIDYAQDSGSGTAFDLTLSWSNPAGYSSTYGTVEVKVNGTTAYGPTARDLTGSSAILFPGIAGAVGATVLVNIVVTGTTAAYGVASVAVDVEAEIEQ